MLNLNFIQINEDVEYEEQEYEQINRGIVSIPAIKQIQVKELMERIEEDE